MNASSSHPHAPRDCGLELGDWLLEEYQPLTASTEDSGNSDDSEYGEFDEDDFDDEFDDA